MIPDYSKKGDGAGRTADLSVANRERKRPSEIMKILILLTLMAAAYFVARGDQHAGCASVIAADGRVWNNVRMDWTIARGSVLSDATGHRITTLPEKTTSYSYTTDSWYLGVFAWVFIAAVIGYGTYTVVGTVRLVLRKVMAAQAKAVTPRKEAGEDSFL
jgi:hypothetical protein